MRKFLIAVAALALVAAAFAGENTGKIVTSKVAGPGDSQPFATVVNDDAGNPLVEVTCTKLGEGTKDVKLYWLDPEHMPKDDANVDFTWGDKIENRTVKNNVAGILALRDFHPGGDATITVKVHFVGNVVNRLHYGEIKAANLVPVANRPGVWGSVVHTQGLKGESANLPQPKYLDLTEYGATIAVNGNTDATVTWTYDPKKGFMVDYGQLDIGIMIINR